MNKGKVELSAYRKTKDASVFDYLVEHNNGSTSVDQLLTISSIDGLFDPKWVAKLALDEFPPQETPQKAAIKMAEWLERLAAAMRSGEYQSLPRAEFKELDERVQTLEQTA